MCQMPSLDTLHTVRLSFYTTSLSPPLPHHHCNALKRTMKAAPTATSRPTLNCLPVPMCLPDTASVMDSTCIYLAQNATPTLPQVS